MVAYSFKSRFAEPILAGTKGGTIRADRRRHARPGEEVQLYTAMRTKHCRLIARKTCLAVEEITLDFRRQQIWRSFGIAQSAAQLDLFARFDGFAEWDEMSGFWAGTEVFDGWHIRWLPLPALISGAAS